MSSLELKLLIYTLHIYIYIYIYIYIRIYIYIYIYIYIHTHTLAAVPGLRLGCTVIMTLAVTGTADCKQRDISVIRSRKNKSASNHLPSQVVAVI